MLKGIDISYANSVVDFDKIKATGIDFVIIRVGYGKNNIDAQFLRNIQECNRLGIPCGVYWFTYATSTEMARQEARYCLDAIKPYKVDYPVFFDLEYDSFKFAMGKDVNIDANANALAFLEEIEKAGYIAGNYTNKDYVNRVFSTEVLAYPTWLAYYRNNDGSVPNGSYQYITPHTMLQYTSRGKVNGINGHVDLNQSFVDYANKIGNIPTDTWILENGKWWYKLADGTCPKEKWLQLGEHWYYFDKEGWMHTGWLLYKGDWYFLQPEEGHMVTDTLIDLRGRKYYMKPDGKMAYTDKDGALV